jgi:hypothetical protein
MREDELVVATVAGAGGPGAVTSLAVAGAATAGVVAVSAAGRSAEVVPGSGCGALGAGEPAGRVDVAPGAGAEAGVV